jgi:hypothetical protein
MSRKNQNSRIQFKYSTIGGTEPSVAPSMDHTDGTWSPTDLYVGEFFLNAVDDTMWVRTLTGIIPITSGTTTVNISTFVNKTGDTMTGELVVPTLSATTALYTPQIYADTFTGGAFYGDGSNLTGLPVDTFTGGTVNGDTTFTAGVDLTLAAVSANTISTAGGLDFIGGDVNVNNNLDVVGAVTATTYYGDGSNLTGISGATGYWELEPTNGLSMKPTITLNYLTNAPDYGIIAGGRLNTLDNSDYSAFLGGLSNTIEDCTSAHMLSSLSTITNGSNYSIIAGGVGNQIDANSYAYIIGGSTNTLDANNSSGIIGGEGNTLDGNSSSSAIISGDDNVMTNCNRSVILGGQNLTATTSDTVYVDNLNINTVGGGASINNLGIDTNGNVVVGSGGASTPDLDAVLTQGNTTSGNNIILTTTDEIQHSLNDTNRFYFPNSGETKMASTDTPGGGFPSAEAFIICSGRQGTITLETTNLIEMNCDKTLFTGQIEVGSLTGRTFTANSYNFDADAGMVVELDAQGTTGTGTITFTNEEESATYTIILIQGSGTYDVDFPSGYWLNDGGAFDFSTLADNDRAMITATRLNGVWYFAAKSLTFV